MADWRAAGADLDRLKSKIDWDHRPNIGGMGDWNGQTGCARAGFQHDCVSGRMRQQGIRTSHCLRRSGRCFVGWPEECELGPQDTKVGVMFNVQPDGDASFWVHAIGHRKGATRCSYLNGVQLRSAISGSPLPQACRQTCMTGRMSAYSHAFRGTAYAKR